MITEWNYSNDNGLKYLKEKQNTNYSKSLRVLSIDTQ